MISDCFLKMSYPQFKPEKKRNLITLKLLHNWPFSLNWFLIPAYFTKTESGLFTLSIHFLLKGASPASNKK